MKVKSTYTHKNTISFTTETHGTLQKRVGVKQGKKARRQLCAAVRRKHPPAYIRMRIQPASGSPNERAPGAR